MRFLTKPVRNLLLATVFGTALVLVETEPVLATYRGCPTVGMECIALHQPFHWGGEDPDEDFCYFGQVVTMFWCMHATLDEDILESSELCYQFTPSGTPVYCE